MFTHNRFLEFHRNIYKSGYTTGLNSGKVIKLDVITKSSKKAGIIYPERSQLLVVSGTIKMSYEAIVPLFALGGHEHRLLLFIIAYCAKTDDNSFKWSHMIADEYMELYKIASGDTVKPETIRLSLVKLNKHNIIQKQSKGNYILNPLYSARPNVYAANKLFNKYLEKFLSHTDALKKALFKS